MPLQYPSPLPAAVLSSLDVAVLQRRDDGLFSLLGQAPRWLPRIWPGCLTLQGLDPAEALYMVEYFMDEATTVWSADDDRWATSGPWTQTDDTGTDWVLEAVAMRSNNHDLLLIKFPTTDHDTLREILQKSRNQNLEYSQLVKEINKREVLLHCIIHDLSTPLAGIKGSLMLIKEDDMIRPAGNDLLSIAMNQVNKMQGLIREILTTFSSEVQPLVPTYFSEETAPSMRDCIDEVANVLGPLASRDHVTFRVADSAIDVRGSKVAADRARLERVIFNIVDNALRHAPPETEILFDVRDKGDAIFVSVSDSGPGVPIEEVDKLFDKFSQGSVGAGKSGLGLYFCRITVEGWGGSVGYEATDGGGATFWLRIPKPSGSTPTN